jgi:phosphatidate cytidylyltransferase
MALVVALTVLGLRELYRLVTAASGHAPAPAAMAGLIHWTGYALGLLVPLSAHVQSDSTIAGLAVLLGLVAVIGAACAGAFAPRDRRSTLASWLVALAGSLLISGAFTHVILLRHLIGVDMLRLGRLAVPPGAGWLTLVIATCWTADTAAYAVGKTLGRHKLWPAVSPGKTIEGAVGGLAGAVLITLGIGLWLGLPVVDALCLGVVLGAAGQLGDLGESKLKRWAGVKDSGALLPGHGGVLDRFDSLLVNAPLAWCYLRFVVGV